LLPGQQGLQLTVTGAPGSFYYIDAATNLSAPVWTPVGGVTNAGGMFEFIDSATNFNQRFYRTYCL